MTKTVTITAGHGGGDPGAVNGNITEAYIATDMRNMLKLYLERAGVKVRTDDAPQPVLQELPEHPALEGRQDSRWSKPVWHGDSSV